MSAAEATGLTAECPAPPSGPASPLDPAAAALDGAATAGATGARFLRPNPQLLAKLASALVAFVPVPVPVPVPAPRAGGDPASGDGRGTWYDDVRRRWCCSTWFVIPSMIDSSGEGDGEGDGWTPAPPAAISCAGCSEIASAVVAAALAALADAPKLSVGIRALEKRDDVELRDAREPGRSGDGRCDAPVDPAPAGDVTSVGDGGGGGEVAGEADPLRVRTDGARSSSRPASGDAGVAVSAGDGARVPADGGVAGIGSSPFSVTGACARRRDSADGPAVGDELARCRTGKRCDAGARVTPKDSSTSGSGGPGGGESASAGAAAAADSLSVAEALRDEVFRFPVWVTGCVQSSTSSM
jgi:hypothetical protein